MAKKQKIIMLEKVYHTYEVEADTIEEGVDKLGESIGHTGKPIKDVVERLSTELEFEFYDDRWLEIK